MTDRVSDPFRELEPAAQAWEDRALQGLARASVVRGLWRGLLALVAVAAVALVCWAVLR